MDPYRKFRRGRRVTLDLGRPGTHRPLGSRCANPGI